MFFLNSISFSNSQYQWPNSYFPVQNKEILLLQTPKVLTWFYIIIFIAMLSLLAYYWKVMPNKYTCLVVIYFKRLMLVSLLTEMFVTEYLTQSFELIINKFGIKLKKLESEKAIEPGQLTLPYYLLFPARSWVSNSLSNTCNTVLVSVVNIPVLMLALHTMFLSPFRTEYLVPKGLLYTWEVIDY